MDKMPINKWLLRQLSWESTMVLKQCANDFQIAMKRASRLLNYLMWINKISNNKGKTNTHFIYFSE